MIKYSTQFSIKMDKINNFIKWISVCINFILFVFSVGLIGLSSYVMIYMSKQCDISTGFGAAEAIPFIILNIIGALICIGSFMGCFGWIFENHRFVITYIAVLSVLLIFLIGASVVLLGPFKVKTEKINYSK